MVASRSTHVLLHTGLLKASNMTHWTCQYTWSASMFHLFPQAKGHRRLGLDIPSWRRLQSNWEGGHGIKPPTERMVNHQAFIVKLGVVVVDVNLPVLKMYINQRCALVLFCSIYPSTLTNRIDQDHWPIPGKIGSIDASTLVFFQHVYVAQQMAKSRILSWDSITGSLANLSIP